MQIYKSPTISNSKNPISFTSKKNKDLDTTVKDQPKTDTLEKSNADKEECKGFWNKVKRYFYPIKELVSGTKVKYLRWNKNIKTSTETKNGQTYDKVEGESLYIRNADKLIAEGKHLNTEGNSQNNDFEFNGNDSCFDGKEGNDTLKVNGNNVSSKNIEDVEYHGSDGDVENAENVKYYGDNGDIEKAKDVEYHGSDGDIYDPEKVVIEGDDNTIYDSEHKSYETHMDLMPVYNPATKSTMIVPTIDHDPIKLNIEELDVIDPKKIDGLRPDDFEEIKSNAKENIKIIDGKGNVIRLDP